MADGDDTSPFGSTPSVAANVPAAVAPVVEAPVTNPEAARNMGLGFLAKHQAAMDARTKEVDNVFSKQQLNVDTMSKLLDDTTASLKRSREGRSNLPLMALGAGMMSSPGDFGTQLGAGVKQMVPAIQQQRGEEDDYQYKLAQLAMKRAGVENAPLQDKLAYLRALQVGDEATIRAIEAGLIKVEGQTAKGDAKLAQNKDIADQKAINNALAEARKQTDSYYKDQTPDPEERDYETRKRFAEMARSMGISEDAIRKFAPQMVAVPGGPEIDLSGKPRPKPVFRGDLITPGDTEDDEKKRIELGLPKKPVGYVYDRMPSRVDRQKQLAQERADWNKDTKDWDKAQSAALSQLNNYDEMDRLIDANKPAQGPVRGLPRGQEVGWNPLTWNTSPGAQKLNSLFAKSQTVDIPQGQGAVSDFERKLFASAAPNMGNLPEVNKGLIQIQRQILKDQAHRRQFAETYYGHYKTTEGLASAWDRYIQSGSGSAAIKDDNGNLVPNPRRMSWQEYFAKEGVPQRATGGQFARGGSVGGPIRLGAEWSDG